METRLGVGCRVLAQSEPSLHSSCPYPHHHQHPHHPDTSTKAKRPSGRPLHPILTDDQVPSALLNIPRAVTGRTNTWPRLGSQPKQMELLHVPCPSPHPGPSPQPALGLNPHRGPTPHGEGNRRLHTKQEHQRLHLSDFPVLSYPVSHLLRGKYLETHQMMARVEKSS